jgi:hypothetical protein
MVPFIPLALGAATIITAALTYETGKNAKAKFERKRRKRLNSKARP